MALLSTRETLSRCLETMPACDWPHVWVSAEGVLVVGEFPIVRATFDFGAECFRNAEETTVNGIVVKTQQVAQSDNPSSVLATAEKKLISLIHEAPRWTETIEIQTPNAIYKVGSATRALISGLEIIEDLAPGTLEQFSKEKGRSKRPVSRNRADLYDLPTQVRYSHQLKNGYWVGTNNKAEEAIGYVKRAAYLAGLNGKVTVHRTSRA